MGAPVGTADSKEKDRDGDGEGTVLGDKVVAMTGTDDGELEVRIRLG